MGDFEETLGEMMGAFKKRFEGAESKEDWKVKKQNELKEFLLRKSQSVSSILQEAHGSAVVNEQRSSPENDYVYSYISIKFPSQAVNGVKRYSESYYEGRIMLSVKMGEALIAVDAQYASRVSIQGYPKMVKEDELESEVEAAIVRVVQAISNDERPPEGT